MTEKPTGNTFVRGNTNAPQTWREYLALMRKQFPGIPKEDIRDNWRYHSRCETWLNETHHVELDKETEHGFEGLTLWHLSIKRHDRKPENDWRILQDIKNQIVGPECEAMEIFPAESRLVDTSNQYHLYAFPDPEQRIPCGFFTGRVVMDTVSKGSNAVQRPRKKADKDVRDVFDEQFSETKS